MSEAPETAPRQMTEIERRFLIRRPADDLLRRHGGTVSRIAQDYLSAPEGVTDRVRARTEAGETVYTRTVKRLLTGMSREETEERLSPEQYRVLLGRRDASLRTVEKSRWCIPYEDRLLEVDVFPFWERQAILEIELPEENAPFALPGWLEVIREITYERRYSNRALAASVPDQEI